MRSRRSAARQDGLQSRRRAAPNALARSLVPTPNRLQVGRLTMSACTTHFGLLFGDYFLLAGALDSRCIFRLTVWALEGARANKPHSEIGDELERAEPAVRFGSIKKPGAARARPSLVQTIALSRMPAHR